MGHVEIIEFAAGSPVTRFPVRSANHIEFSPDGRWLAYDEHNDIQLYDLQRHRVAATYRGHQGAIRDLHFSHDGRRLGTVSADRTLKLWSVPAGELLYSVIAHSTDAIDLAMAPDDRRIATVGKDRLIRLWDGQGEEPLWEYPVSTGAIGAICFSGDGHRLLCLGYHQDLLILDGSPAALSSDGLSP